MFLKKQIRQTLVQTKWHPVEACVLNKAWPFGNLLDEHSVHESKHEFLPSESEPISSDI